MSSHKDLIKKYGDVFLPADFLIEEERKYLSICPTLDSITGGGIPEGSIVNISGQEGSGKSTLALRIAANAQKEGRKVYYLDIEHRLSKTILTGIHGLNTSKEWFEVIRSTDEKKVLTAEDFLNIAFALLKSEKNAVFVLDSASCLCGEGEMSEDIKADFRNGSPKLLANFLRHIAPILILNKSIVIAIFHLIADTGGKGAGMLEDGGNKIRHAANIRLRIKYCEPLTIGSGENEQRVGQVMHCKLIKGPLGQADKIDLYLRYGFGIDYYTEAINLACDFALINKAGAWYNLSFLETPTVAPPKLQGMEKVREYLLENGTEFTMLENKIKESLK